MSKKKEKTIRDVDKNLTAGGVVAHDLREYELPCEPFDLYGVKFDEREGGFYRLTKSEAETVGENVSALRRITAGGRVRFRTDSTVIRIRAKSWEFRLSQMPDSGVSGFALVEKEDGVFVHVATFRPEQGENGFLERTAKLKGGKMREYMLSFPLYVGVESLTLGFDETAKIERGERYKTEKPIVYYGSSVTQGGCASRPDTTFESLISVIGNVDFVNYGLSGSALGEASMAEFLSKIAASVFVIGYDANAPSVEHLRKTHYEFYKTYRERCPQTPIVLVSRPDIEPIPDYEKRVAVVRESYERALADGDKNVYFIDGSKLFPDEYRGFCTVEGSHPNDLGFYFIAKGLNEVIAPLLNRLKNKSNS